MARAPHPADLRDAQIIREATSFAINVFLGRGVYARAEAPTLETARAEADRLEAENPGRRAMIYGVNAEGRSALWTPAMEDLNMETEVIGKDYSAKSAAIRALKRSGLDPDQAEVRCEGKRWTIRRPSDPLAAPASDEDVKATRARADKAVKTLPRRISPAAMQEAARADAIAARAQKRKVVAGRKAKAEAKATPPRDPGAPRGRYAQAIAAAQAGQMPSPPDFSAETHAPYRKRLADLQAMAKAGDLAGLKAQEIKPYNSSMIPLARYRDLCVMALEARA